MSDYLHIRDWRKFRRGEIVIVKTYLYPEIDGIYQLYRVHVSSNFPYRIWFDNREQLLKKTEVYKVSELTRDLIKPTESSASAKAQPSATEAGEL